jgi:hypothetical protein
MGDKEIVYVQALGTSKNDGPWPYQTLSLESYRPLVLYDHVMSPLVFFPIRSCELPE